MRFLNTRQVNKTVPLGVSEALISPKGVKGFPEGEQCCVDCQSYQEVGFEKSNLSQAEQATQTPSNSVLWTVMMPKATGHSYENFRQASGLPL